MKEWPSGKITDLVQFRTGKLNSNAEVKNGKYPFFTCSPETLRIDDYAFDCEALLLAGNNAEGNFALKYYAGKFNAYQRTYVITIPETRFLSYKYLFYALQTRLVDLKNVSAGSATKFLTLSILNDIEVPLPAVEEQKSIASVLSSLDDKIDLLHRQNKTLEAMAETLFRQWFVEGAGEAKPVVLCDYVEVFNGVSYKSDDLQPSKTAMVTLKSFDRNGGFRLDGFKEFTGKYKPDHVVEQGDLVVAHTDITQDAAVIGNPVLVVADPAYEKLVISMDLVKVKSRFDWLTNEFLYVLMRTGDFKQHCLGYSNGSTVLHLSKKAIPSYEFNLPSMEKAQEFSLLAKNLFSKKFKNIEQVRSLEKLRDGLLPKLMSGEVRIS